MDVSIVIPTYNRLWCLPRAIQSCLNTVCKTEIIVVDDGSNDGTWEWLSQQKDIIKIWQTNQGQTYAINAGTKIALGKYIRFLDSDDFLEDGIIDRQFAKAEEEEALLVYSRVDKFSEEKQMINRCPETGEWIDFMEVQLSNRYGSHFLGMLFHKNLVNAVPRRPDFAFREDRMFLLEVALLEPKTAYVEGCAGYWVQHDSQMQGNYHGLKSQVTNWQHLHIFKRIIPELEKKGILTQARRNAACTTLWPLAHWIAKSNLQDAIEVVNWIYQLNPDFHPPENGILGFVYRKLGFKRTEQLLKIRRILKFGWT